MLPMRDLNRRRKAEKKLGKLGWVFITPRLGTDITTYSELDEPSAYWPEPPAAEEEATIV